MKSLMRNFSVYMLKSVFSIVIPLIMIPYASRVLGPTGIGSVQYAQSWVSYFSLIAGLGISSYAIREGSKIRDDAVALGKFSTEMVGISIISTVLSSILFVLFLIFFKQIEEYRLLLVICGLSIFGTGLNTEWVCTIFEDYDYVSKRSIAFQLIAVLVLFATVRKSADVNAYAVVLILPTLASMIVNIFYSKRNISWKIDKRTFSLVKHLKAIICIFGVSLASTIYLSLDSTMLGYIRGDESVGLYTAASRLTKSVLGLINASCTVFLPRLSYFAGKNQKEEFQNLVSRVMSILLLVAIPCAVGLFVLAKQTLVIFSGQGFIAAEVPMKILAINLIFSSIDGFLAWQVLIPMNKESVVLIATIIGSIADFILNFMLIPIAGVSGAALSTLLAEVCVCIITVGASTRIICFDRVKKNLAQYICVSISFLFIYREIESLFSSVITVVLLMVLICASVYILLLLLLKNDMILWLIKRMNSTLRIKR